MILAIITSIISGYNGGSSTILVMHETSITIVVFTLQRFLSLSCIFLSAFLRVCHIHIPICGSFEEMYMERRGRAEAGLVPTWVCQEFQNSEGASMVLVCRQRSSTAGSEKHTRTMVQNRHLKLGSPWMGIPYNPHNPT